MGARLLLDSRDRKPLSMEEIHALMRDLVLEPTPEAIALGAVHRPDVGPQAGTMRAVHSQNRKPPVSV